MHCVVISINYYNTSYIPININIKSMENEMNNK